MSWLDAAPGIVALAAMWLVPGAGVLRLLGVRGLLAWGAAPAVTSGMAGVGAVALAWVGLRWSLASFAACTLLAWLMAAVIGHLLGTLRDAPRRVTGQRELLGSERVWLALTWLLGGGVLTAGMMAGMRAADQPPQAWDGIFHLNAMWFIRETGNASSLGGLGPMYADTIAPYYPTVWHSIVAIAPGFEGVTEAANSSSVVLGSVIWIGGLVTLARVVWPRQALPVVLTPVLACTYVTFPDVAVSMLAVWPFALSVACLSGMLALLISAIRKDLGPRVHAAYGLGVAAAASGVVLSHGSGLFSLALLAIPVGGLLAARQAHRYWRRGYRLRVAVISLTVLIGGGAVAAAVLTSAPVTSIINYQRGGQDSYLPGLWALFIDHPLIYVYDVRAVNVVVTLLVLLGVGVCLWTRHARWLVLALVVSAALTLLAAGPPESPLRALSGLWYTQASRINQIVLIPAIMLAAGGGAWLIGRLSRGGPVPTSAATAALVLAIATLTLGFRWPMHTQVMASTYSTWPIAWGTMLEEDEIAMVDRAATSLPDGAVVLGEPTAGLPFLLARSDVQVVYPHLTPIAGSPERLLLARSFNRWETEPEVCEAVRSLGVTHVYADKLTFAEGAKWEEETPGLRRIRPDGDSFEFVDSGGKASLWRFTGCDL
ncbi:hypothetical protein BH23ACT6_BH23ACT6_13370 [soil metagenome]